MSRNSSNPQAEKLARDMSDALAAWDKLNADDIDDSMLDNPRFSSALDTLEKNIHGMSSELDNLLKIMKK